jgi:integrase
MKITAGWLDSRKLARNRRQDRQEVPIEGHRGMYAWVYPSGAIVFVYRYTRPGTTERRKMRLGEYGKGGITLEEAFDLHRHAQRELEKGLDPIEEREKRRQAEERARSERAGADTVARLVEQFVHRRLRAERWDESRGTWVRDERAKTKARKRPNQAAALLGYAPPDAAPRKRKGRRRPVPTFVDKLGHIKAPELTKRQIIAFLDSIVDRGAPVVANRVHALLVQLFKWAAAKDIIPASPLVSIERPGGPEASRTRALSADEIRAFWSKLDTADMAEPTKLALKLLLLTGQRRGEITLAAWSHFDLNAKLWTIPVDLLKSSHSRRANVQPHAVPLAEPAIKILDRLREITGNGRFVLPAHASSRHSKPYSAGVLTRAVHQNEKHFSIPHFTPHDLRRTCRTGLSQLKVAPHIAERVLNHAPPKMEGTYDMYEYLDEKRVALERWATHLTAIVEGLEDSFQARA